MPDMTAADSLVGTWLFTSYEGEPYKEPRIIMTIARSSALFSVSLTKEGELTFEMGGLAEANGSISGKGINRITGEPWDVKVTSTGVDQAKAVFDEIKPVESLAGTWGAEKIGGTK